MEGSESAASARDPARRGAFAPATLAASCCAVACLAILAAKFVIAAKINVNWDEFYFLSHVYALARGELEVFLQGAYAHAFRWVTGAGGNEVDQIVDLRLGMCVLLAASAGLVFLLARLHASTSAAWFAVFAYLASWPVLRHGASFRADAILLPLTLAAFYFVLRRGKRPGLAAIVAGACLGLAFVVSVKAILLLPALAAMAALPDARWSRGFPRSLLSTALRLSLVLAVAGIVAVLLLALHRAQLVPASEPVGVFARRTLAAAIVEAPFFPRREQFVQLVAIDPVYWIGVVVGFLAAVRQRAFATAAAVLCFSPLLFYRNAYAYYFPVMMAPAAVLVAVAADALLDVRHPRGRRPALALVAAGGVALLHAAWDGIARLRFDGQAGERAAVAAVHRIFPEPVPYLDHSGMIASFPKVNFLMSGWGIEQYLERGEDFMPSALERRCPPLLLVNHSVLKPGSLQFRQLRPADRALLESRFLPYWGPVRLAGATAEIAAGESKTVRVPCSGRYRAKGGDVRLDGLVIGDGEVVELEGEREYRLESADPASPRSLALLWADAREPPPDAPPRMPLYEPL